MIPTPRADQVRSDFSRLTPEESAVFEAVMERYVDIEIELHIARHLMPRPKERYSIPFRAMVERDIDTSLKPRGMHVGFPKITIETNRMQRLLAIVDALNHDNERMMGLITKMVEGSLVVTEQALEEAKKLLQGAK